MFLQGMNLILSEPMCLIWVFIGVIVGIIFGSIPGLTASMAIVVFLPVTFGLTALQGMATMVALFVGGISGGLISAILLNMPGTASSVATCFDGNPMAKQGKADKALGGAIVFSFLATLFSIIALVFVAPPLASLAIKFGPHEYFSISILALSMIITLSSNSLRKGLMTGIVGIMFSGVGMDPVAGLDRFTYSIPQVKAGFHILTVLIGLYSIPEILSSCKVQETIEQSIQDVRMKGFGITWKEFTGQIPNFIRSAFIGLGIGILPGIGGATSNIVAYTVAKNNSKHPERFGKGELTGVIASESANNSMIGGAMIPLLTLGIPGDAVTAMMLGGLMIHGIVPGPLIFQNYGPLMYAIFIFLVLSSFTMLIAEFFGLKLFVKVLRIPKYYLLPIIVALCIVGAFGTNSRIFDVGAVILFGIIGYLLNTFDYPLPPLVMGFILGGILETNLRRAITSSNGNYWEFFTRPISGGVLIFALLFICWSLYKVLYVNKKKVMDTDVNSIYIK